MDHFSIIIAIALSALSVVESVFSPSSRSALKTAIDNCLSESPVGDCSTFTSTGGGSGCGETCGVMAEWDVSKCVDMHDLFGRLSWTEGGEKEYADRWTHFNQDISKWRVSQVTNMNRMFIGALAFDQDLSKWSVGKVSDFGEMFSSGDTTKVFDGNARLSVSGLVFNSPIFRIGSAAVSLQNMFYNTQNFNQDISNWDISKVQRIDNMFLLSKAFNQDVSKWSIEKVTNFGGIFYHAAAFNFRTNIDASWTSSRCKQATNGCPSSMLYSGGCPMDTTCGFCGKLNSLPPVVYDSANGNYEGTTFNAVVCSAGKILKTSAPCTFCENDSIECCTVTSCTDGYYLTDSTSAQGQEAYTTPGTYSWIAPLGVTQVHVVAVGGGGSGGGGGGLGYKNNIPVTAGNSYPVVVGAGGPSLEGVLACPGGAGRTKENGEDSTFISDITVKGGKGYGCYINNGNGGIFIGDGGGNGGGSASAGGGAGGYSGNGGDGSGHAVGKDGAGGGGAGGYGGGTYGPGTLFEFVVVFHIL